MEADNEEESLRAFLHAIRPVRVLVTVLLLLLIAGLPLVLFRYRGAIGVTAYLAAMYLVLAAIALELYRTRRRVGLSFATATRLAFEALACPPLGINVVRKLSLARGIAGDPMRFARQNFEPALFAGLVGKVSARIEDQLEDGAAPEELGAYRERLNAMVK